MNIVSFIICLYSLEIVWLPTESVLLSNDIVRSLCSRGDCKMLFFSKESECKYRLVKSALPTVSRRLLPPTNRLFAGSVLLLALSRERSWHLFVFL